MGNEKIQGSAQSGVESIGVVLELLEEGLLDEGNILLVQYLAAHEMEGDAAFARLAILFRSREVVRCLEHEPAANGYATDLFDSLQEKNGEICSLFRMLNTEQRNAFLKFLDKYFAAVLRDASLPPRKIYTFLSDYKDFVPHICMSYLAQGGSLIGRLGSLMKENGVEDFFERFLSSLYSVNKKAYGREALALGRYFVSVGQFERASEYLDNASYHLDELYECRFLMLCCKLRAKSEEEFVRVDGFSMTMPEYVQLCVALSGHPDKMKHYSDLAHRNIEHAKTKTEATVAPKAPKKSAKRGKLAAILAALATVLGLTALLVVFVIKPVENEQTWSNLGYKKYADGLGLSSFSDGLVNGSGEVIIPEKIGGVNVVSLERLSLSSERITRVSIPSTMVKIEEATFVTAKNITEILVDESNLYYTSVDGVLYTKDMTTLVAYPASKQGTIYYVPDTVVRIAERAFDSSIYLKEVHIPNSVVAMGDNVFTRCYNLTRIYCDMAKQPEGWASDWNSWGVSVKWETEYEYIDIQGIEYFLDNTTMSATVTGYTGSASMVAIPSVIEGYTVKAIAEGAFRYCDSPTCVTIPDSVTTIGYEAFYYCSELKNVTIGNGVARIDERAFYGCYNLMDVYITDLAAWCNIEFGNYLANPLYYAKNLYLNGELVDELIIPDEVISIGCIAFYHCDSLVSVTIPDNVTSIGEDAFRTCVNLTSVSIGNAVTAIGSCAFCSCVSLTSVKIPDNVTSIGYSAFEGCDSLTIYCVAESQPDGWSDSWNASDRPVIWGYTEE